MSRRDELAAALAATERRIEDACAAAGRDRGELTLIVVTKTYPASDVDHLVDLGVVDVGENRHPDAERTMTELAGMRPDLPRLHFLGGLQTNKAGAVARYADAVHSVDRAKLARSLDRGAEAADRVLGCLVQVDVDATDPGRSGVVPEGVPELADLVASCEHLRLDGVMTVAPLGEDPRRSFDELAQISARLRTDHPGATMISAGMSADLEQAIAAGATHLRVGRSILGERATTG
jgi:hypothetical protein